MAPDTATKRAKEALAAGVKAAFVMVEENVAAGAVPKHGVRFEHGVSSVSTFSANEAGSWVKNFKRTGRFFKFIW